MAFLGSCQLLCHWEILLACVLYDSSTTSDRAKYPSITVSCLIGLIITRFVTPKSRGSLGKLNRRALYQTRHLKSVENDVSCAAACSRTLHPSAPRTAASLAQLHPSPGPCRELSATALTTPTFLYLSDWL